MASGLQKPHKTRKPILQILTGQNVLTSYQLSGGIVSTLIEYFKAEGDDFSLTLAGEELLRILEEPILESIPPNFTKAQLINMLVNAFPTAQEEELKKLKKAELVALCNEIGVLEYEMRTGMHKESPTLEKKSNG